MSNPSDPCNRQKWNIFLFCPWSFLNVQILNVILVPTLEHFLVQVWILWHCIGIMMQVKSQIFLTLLIWLLQVIGKSFILLSYHFVLCKSSSTFFIWKKREEIITFELSVFISKSNDLFFLLEKEASNLHLSEATVASTALSISKFIPLMPPYFVTILLFSVTFEVIGWGK